MKATTTVLPLYWLMWICLPCPRLMAKSGEGRGSMGAAGIAVVSRVRAAITRKKRIASVYRRGQTFHAGNYGAFAAQFEAAVVAGAGDGVVGFGSDGHAVSTSWRAARGRRRNTGGRRLRCPTPRRRAAPGGRPSCSPAGRRRSRASAARVRRRAPCRNTAPADRCAPVRRAIRPPGSCSPWEGRAAGSAGSVGLTPLKYFSGCRICWVETGGLRKTSPKPFCAVAIEDRILEEHALGIGEDQREPQVERRIVEDRELAAARHRWRRSSWPAAPANP